MADKSRGEKRRIKPVRKTADEKSGQRTTGKNKDKKPKRKKPGKGKTTGRTRRFPCGDIYEEKECGKHIYMNRTKYTS